jgi:hypothetical protein
MINFLHAFLHNFMRQNFLDLNLYITRCFMCLPLQENGASLNDFETISVTIQVIATDSFGIFLS